MGVNPYATGTVGQYEGTLISHLVMEARCGWVLVIIMYFDGISSVCAVLLCFPPQFPNTLSYKVKTPDFHMASLPLHFDS